VFTKKILIIVCLALIPQTGLTQTYFGFRAEFLHYIVQVDRSYIGPPLTFSTEKSSKGDLGLFFPLTFHLVDNLSISSRIGLVLGDLYVGPDLSALAILKIIEESYLLGGLNIHRNMELGGHSKEGSSKMIPFVVIGFGYRFKSFGPIEMQFTYQLNDEKYGYAREYAEKSSIRSAYYKALWMIKLNFGIEFEL
jgi:hypothetical protein